MRKMRENLKNRRNPSHQISENFGKSWNFVIFWYFGFIKVYFVFWYFACISYFNFEIFKIPQPEAGGRRLASNCELTLAAGFVVLKCPLARLKRTPYPPDRKIRDFAEIISAFFGNPLTPNSSKFEISPKFCEAFFNSVKFRQIFIKICSKTREIDSKFAKNDEIWWKKMQK